MIDLVLSKCVTNLSVSRTQISHELICDIYKGARCRRTRWSTYDLTCTCDMVHKLTCVTNPYVTNSYVKWSTWARNVARLAGALMTWHVCVTYVTNSYMSRTHMWFDLQGLKILQDSLEHSCNLLQEDFVIICVTNLYVSRTHMIYRGSRCCRTRWSTHVICCKKILWPSCKFALRKANGIDIYIYIFIYIYVYMCIHTFTYAKG